MQLIAMITMLIDHLGYVFFPDERWMRIVGRIAFPIYCYLLVAGYRRTRSKKRYAIRLFVLALLSQLPFMFAFVTDGVNVIGTLFVALIVMMIIDHFKGNVALQVLMGFLLILAVQVPLEALNFDYAVYGVLTVLVYRYLPSALGMLAGQFVLNMLFIFVFHFSGIIQLYSLITTIFIAGLRLASPETKTEIRLPAGYGALSTPLTWRSSRCLNGGITAIRMWVTSSGYFDVSFPLISGISPLSTLRYGYVPLKCT